MTYKLDDGTGSSDAKKWNDADAMESNPLAAKLIEGAYCRVWGKLNSFNNRRHVVAQIIRPVEDMNEVSYHMLDATAIHLYYTRGPPGQSDGVKVQLSRGVGVQRSFHNTPRWLRRCTNTYKPYLKAIKAFTSRLLLLRWLWIW